MIVGRKRLVLRLLQFVPRSREVRDYCLELFLGLAALLRGAFIAQILETFEEVLLEHDKRCSRDTNTVMEFVLKILSQDLPREEPEEPGQSGTEMEIESRKTDEDAEKRHQAVLRLLGHLDALIQRAQSTDHFLDLKTVHLLSQILLRFMKEHQRSSRTSQNNQSLFMHVIKSIGLLRKNRLYLNPFQIETENTLCSLSDLFISERADEKKFFVWLMV